MSAHSSADPLRLLEERAGDLGAVELAAEARAVASRVHERRFFVACVGQFKRGKSTLLNALVGASVLPVGVTPVTAVVTVLRHGRSVEARVRIAAEDWRTVPIADLPAYVSEAENPENAKGVTAVEVFVPSALLASGLCLVDTPGIGSVFEGNTEATRAFVPQIDAALVVLGADPPISGEELRLIGTVAKEVHDFVFALAKADRLQGDEVRQAKAFTERVLADVTPGATVFEISAVETASRGSPTRDWTLLVEALESLGARRGAALVSAAERRGIERIGASLRREVDERRHALRRPREESERRLDVLRGSVKTAERLLADAGPLFAAIEARLSKRLEGERDRFLGEACVLAERRLSDAIDDLARERAPQPRVLEAAQKIARDVIESWRRTSAPQAERWYAESASDLVAVASDVLQRLVESGDPAFADLGSSLDVDTRFRAPPHFYFAELLTLSGRSIGTSLRTAFAGDAGRRRALLARALPYMRRLIETNSARVTNDFIDQTRESRRRLESDVACILRGVTSSVERAIREATDARSRGDAAVADALRRLDEAAAEIDAITGSQDGR